MLCMRLILLQLPSWSYGPALHCRGQPLVRNPTGFIMQCLQQQHCYCRLEWSRGLTRHNRNVLSELKASTESGLDPSVSTKNR